MAVFIGLAAIPVVTVALLQTGAPLFDRVSELVAGDTSVNVSADSRDRFNDYALDQLGDRLVVGIGLDADSHEVFPAPSSSGANHNMYLMVLVDSGLPGLVGLLIILWWAAKTSWQLVRTTEDPELYSLSLALLGSVVAGSVQAYFNPVQHERMYWFAVAMTSVVWALRRHEATTGGPQASAARTPLNY
jgi:O-antigen ligase